MAQAQKLTHLRHQSKIIADFLIKTGLARQKPSLEPLFDDSFVKALAGTKP